MGDGTNVGDVDLAATATSHGTSTEAAGASMAGHTSISIGAHATTESTTSGGSSTGGAETGLSLTVLKGSLVDCSSVNGPGINLPREHRQVCP